jgi:hypothetical protein
MGKAVVTGWIEEESKEAIAATAKVVSGSIASFLEEIGKQCQSFLDEPNTHQGEFDVQLKFTRRKTK